MNIQPLKIYPLPHSILIPIFIAVCYIILGSLGNYLRAPDVNASTVWPAAGFAYAIILLFGYRAVITIFIGGWIVSYLQVDGSSSNNMGFWGIFFTSLFIGIGCALQAVLGAVFIQRFELPHVVLQRPSSVAKLLLCGIASCAIGATIGVTTMGVAGVISWSEYLKIWITWFTGDSGGVFLVTPFMLAWLRPYNTQRYPGTVIEIIGLCLLFIVVTLINYKLDARFMYLFFPGLIWATTHFGFRGTTLTLIYTMACIIIATINGLGVHVRPTLYESLFFLELYMITIAGTILLLAAELERRVLVYKKWEGSSNPLRFVNRIRIFFGVSSKDE